MDAKQPNLIATTILLVLGVGIIYFLDIPLFDKDKVQNDKIASFSEQKRLREEYTKRIAQIGINLKDLDWEEKRKKIDPNFISTPFFIPKMEVFFKDLVARSNMALVSISIETGSALTPSTTADGKIAPVEDASLDVPKNQSGVIGIKGPVKKNSFNLSVSGRYEDMKNLLLILEKQAYLISVRTVNFGEGKGNQFNFTIVGDIYSY